jgi:hypothetical protein
MDNTPETPISFENWVTEFIGNLCGYFDLAGWSVEVKFPDQPKDDNYAENRINGTYLHSTISVYPEAREDFDSGDMDRLVLAVVHELVHILLDPFHAAILPFLSPSTTPAFMETLEQQTQRLTMVFLKNLPKNLVPPR